MPARQNCFRNDICTFHSPNVQSVESMIVLFSFPKTSQMNSSDICSTQIERRQKIRAKNRQCCNQECCASRTCCHFPLFGSGYADSFSKHSCARCATDVSYVLLLCEVCARLARSVYPSLERKRALYATIITTSRVAAISIAC